MKTPTSSEHAGGLRSSVVESAYTYLSGRGEPVPLDTVVQHSLALRGKLPEQLVQETAALLSADARFLIDNRGVCSLANWDLGRKLIDEAEFVVFDVESNGGRSGRHRIIELAGVRFSSSGEIAEYSSFVRLARRLPRFISSLTGILPEQLHDAPPVETVLDEFAAFSNGAILVSHNLPADLAFLNPRSHLGETSAFPRRRAGHHGASGHAGSGTQTARPAGRSRTFRRIDVEAAHRALPDARNAAELFRRLTGLAKERGLATVADLRDFVIGADHRGLPRRRAELARWASLNLPALPGVYVFRGARRRRALRRQVQIAATSESAVTSPAQEPPENMAGTARSHGVH